MTGHADLLRINARTPLLIRRQVRDIEADVAWALPDTIAHIESARVIGIGAEKSVGNLPYRPSGRPVNFSGSPNNEGAFGSRNKLFVR
jgi:hypothetical protein